MGLRWGACEGYSNRSFACDASSGAEVLVASFSPPAGLDVVTGVSAFVRVSSASGTVPAWWQLSNGGCRFGAITLSADLSDVSDCEDPWSGQAMGGLVGFMSDSQGLQFQVAVAVPQSAARQAGAGRSYAAFKLLVNHKRSSGAGACDGCNTPVCITLQAMTIGQPNKHPCNDPGCVQEGRRADRGRRRHGRRGQRGDLAERHAALRRGRHQAGDVGGTQEAVPPLGHARARERLSARVRAGRSAPATTSAPAAAAGRRVHVRRPTTSAGGRD